MIRSVRWGLFVAVFGLVSAVIFLATVAGEAVRPGVIARTTPVWSACFRGLARAILGIRFRLTGAPPPAPAIVAAKHQSYYDPLALLDILRNPAVVLKRELLAVPFWRWFARANGAMPVDRGGSAAAVRVMLKGARAAKAAGRLILVFPEGTRVPPGETPPVLPGTTALYEFLKLPVAPLALDTASVWPIGESPRPGEVRMRFADTIPPGLPRAEFESRLHAALNEIP